MAVNASRSMNAELEQGVVDGRYIQLHPQWQNAANPPTERMSWPTYQQAERHRESTMLPVHADCHPCDHDAEPGW